LTLSVCPPYPAGMKRTFLTFLILAIIALNHVRSETETIDLKALDENSLRNAEFVARMLQIPVEMAAPVIAMRKEKGNK
jgi:hypothetical protein